MTRSVAVIHIDALRREYPASWLLARRLEAHGYRAILTSRTSTQRLLRLFTPDVLILSHVYAILRHNGVNLGKRDYLGALSLRAPQ